jgi:hypothetical protein
MPPDEWQQEEIPYPASSPIPKSVLGDSPKPPSHNDSLGRGLKGHAHGSIALKTTTRRRKSGQVKTYQQVWYQWQDTTGKHCRYLTQKQAAEVQKLLDEGAIVAEILAIIDRRK